MRHRNISLPGLIGLGITSLIGSSWLFTAEYSTKIAGYASILSWVIAAIMTLIIALSFMELSTLFSTNGTSSKIPTLIYGPSTGFIFAVFTWLSYMIFVPVESHAIIQYLAVFFPNLLINTYHYVIIGFSTVALICILNLLSIKTISKINNYFTLAKILIPIFVALFIICFFLSTPESGEIKQIYQTELQWKWSNIFNAITMGGIAFSFIGFKTIIEIAGHAKNPKKTIPLSIILVIIISLVIFMLVQIAYFISARHFPTVLSNNSAFGAFGIVASEIGSKLLITILYFSAITFPFICGVVYLRVSIESLNVLITDNFLQKNKKLSINLKAFTLISFICSITIFFIFKSWEQVSTFIAALMAITYLIGPIATIIFRKSIPKVERTYKLKFINLICFTAFYFSTLIFFIAVGT